MCGENKEKGDEPVSLSTSPEPIRINVVWNAVVRKVGRCSESSESKVEAQRWSFEVALLELINLFLCSMMMIMMMMRTTSSHECHRVEHVTHLESGSGFEGCSRQDADQLVESSALLLDLGRSIGWIVTEGPSHVDDALSIAGVLEEVLHQWHVAAHVHDLVREYVVEVLGHEVVVGAAVLLEHECTLSLTAKQRSIEACVQLGCSQPIPLRHDDDD